MDLHNLFLFFLSLELKIFKYTNIATEKYAKQNFQI